MDDAKPLSQLPDSELRDYEQACFQEFEANHNLAAIHSIAAAIVELHRRGLSLIGVWQ